MTMPDEMVNAIINARRFLYALMDPQETPRVPAAVRMEARGRLKHFPHETQFKALAKEINRRKQPC